jgi:hypothetical protein
MSCGSETESRQLCVHFIHCLQITPQKQNQAMTCIATPRDGGNTNAARKFRAIGAPPAPSWVSKAQDRESPEIFRKEFIIKSMVQDHCSYWACQNLHVSKPAGLSPCSQILTPGPYIGPSQSSYQDGCCCGNAVDFDSDGIRFRSLPRSQLPRLRFLWYFSDSDENDGNV